MHKHAGDEIREIYLRLSNSSKLHLMHIYMLINNRIKQPVVLFIPDYFH